MNDDKRSPHSSTLRTFFDEQLEHLQHLASSLSSVEQTKEDQQIVESFVEASNTKMRAVHGYAHKLRGYVQALHSYVLQIADQIPVAIELKVNTFEADPLINALFVNNNDIDKVFSTNPEVTGFLRSHDKDQTPVLYGLLTCEKHEKRVLGVAMQGDMLVRDVPQLAINFCSHHIHIPSASHAELMAALTDYLFNRVVALIKQEMMSRKVEQDFNAKDNSYESKVNSLSNPDVYLYSLIEHIKIPSQLLGITKTHFRLSKLGIQLAASDRQSANAFDISELTWSNNSKNVVLPIALIR